MQISLLMLTLQNVTSTPGIQNTEPQWERHLSHTCVCSRQGSRSKTIIWPEFHFAFSWDCLMTWQRIQRTQNHLVKNWLFKKKHQEEDFNVRLKLTMTTGSLWAVRTAQSLKDYWSKEFQMHFWTLELLYSAGDVLGLKMVLTISYHLINPSHRLPGRKDSTLMCSNRKKTLWNTHSPQQDTWLLLCFVIGKVSQEI